MTNPDYDQAACRRAAELLREEAAYGIGAHATPAAVGPERIAADIASAMERA